MLIKTITALALASSTLAVRAEVINTDAAGLARLMAEGVPVVDIRTAGEWQQSGVLPGSHLLTYFNERGEVDTAAWLARVQKFAKPGQPVALICRSGNRTRAASAFLSEKAGYATVYNVTGGMSGWLAEKRSVESAAPRLAKCAADDAAC